MRQRSANAGPFTYAPREIPAAFNTEGTTPISGHAAYEIRFDCEYAFARFTNHIPCVCPLMKLGPNAGPMKRARHLSSIRKTRHRQLGESSSNCLGGRLVAIR